MPRKIIVPTTIVLCLASSAAWAQTTVSVDEPAPPKVLGAPVSAFEIGVQGGYTQPFGEITPDQNIDDIVDAGGSIAVELGYRINQSFSLSALVNGHRSAVDNSQNDTLEITGVSGTAQFTIHTMPYSRVDPYLAFGAGYRALWLIDEGPDNDRVLHGIEVGRATFGVDFRLSDSVAIGPLMGADVNLFLWDENTDLDTRISVEDPQASTFIFAGVAGRFDVGGRRVPNPNTLVEDDIPAVAHTEPPRATVAPASFNSSR
jgi:hypothetical protein